MADAIVKGLLCALCAEAERYNGFRKKTVADNTGVQIDLVASNIKEDALGADS